MSFNSKNLSVLAYSNGFTIWHYKGANKFSDEFFLPVANLFNIGDIVFATDTATNLMFVSGISKDKVALSSVI